jgi:hypothetical protein
MNLKRSLHLSLLLLSTLATAAAEVPSLINYQGRLVNADGAAQSGQKSFLLEVFGAASGGSLLYREEVGNITLGEGGVYSFQFGATGTSNTQITEIIGTGSEAVLYQQVLSNLPVVAGSVSVNDGTYTWSQASGSSNEDDFSAAFSTNLNRITVNYFSGAPNDGRSIDVTYRYESEGIVGALSSGGEHWLQLTIDGDVQATRERVLAVPFALRAGGLTEGARRKGKKIYISYLYISATSVAEYTFSGHRSGGNKLAMFAVPQGAKKITSVRVGMNANDGRSLSVPMELLTPQDPLEDPNANEIRWEELDEALFATNEQHTFVQRNLDWDLEAGKVHLLRFRSAVFGVSGYLFGSLTLEYEY